MPSLSLELPKRAGLGDISTTLAMTWLPGEEAAARIAELIIRHLPQDQELFDKVEIAGSATLILLKPAYWYETLKIEKRGDSTVGRHWEQASGFKSSL